MHATEILTSQTEELRELREKRKWLVPVGLLMVGLGVVAVLSTFAATLATVLLFGVLLLLGGVALLAEAVSSRSDDFAWELVGGILYLVAGGLLVFDPVSGAIGLTLLLAFFFTFVGVVRISLGLRQRRARGVGGAFVFAGVLDLLLGFLILVGWPETAGWVIGLFLGIELIFAGVSLITVSRALQPRTPRAG